MSTQRNLLAELYVYTAVPLPHSNRIGMMQKLCLFLLITLLAPQTSWAQLSKSSITGSRVRCTNNVAASHACSNIDLLARVSKEDLDPTAKEITDIWGWTDPDTKREYALVGTTISVVFIDVTDPVNPVHLGRLPSHDSRRQIVWRDMKVYKDHMYVVVDGGNNGMQVFDLRQLRSAPRTPKDWIATAHYDKIRTAHNVAINEETGFAYIVGSALSSGSDFGICNNPRFQLGLHIVDIRDPANPVYAGCFSDRSYVNTSRGYTHDTQCVLYRGPDAKYQGREICISSNETHISIADVTDKNNPKMVGAATYPYVAYSHQGWLTEDQKYFLMNDEIDEMSYSSSVSRTRTIIWDLNELEDPVYHSSFFFPTQSTDHNLYVHGNYMYAANYKTGLRIVNISNINEPEEIAFFDTHPNSDSHGTDAGAWSSFRFPGSETTIVSSDPDGLFVLDPTSVPTSTETPVATVPDAFSLSPAYPNPFNPVTSTVLSLPKQTSVRAEVLDMLGRSIRVLKEGVLPPGDHQLTFDASQHPSGSYYIRVQTGQYTTGTKVVLIK